jgi:molybdopterin converting factor small subunit
MRGDEDEVAPGCLGYNAVMNESAAITVRLFGGLDEHVGRSVAEAQASAASVGDLVAGLELSPAAVGLILVNGLHGTLSSPVKAGDEVALFPHIGGG